MSSLVIVAIPSEDDYIYKISSEKVPHMTLLYLGDDVTAVKNLDKIISFVEHSAKTSLSRFGLEVDRRGTLGQDEADVLFFSKSKWSGIDEVNQYRSYLLKEPNIRIAYDSTDQHSEWLPHITLGYPDTPAKPDNRDYPGISYVNFDRIAVWFDEYKGVEFPLKRHEFVMDVAMSDKVKDFIQHFGVKGMKWGVRRAGDHFLERGLAISTPGSRARGAAAAKSARKVKVKDKGKKLRTSGGKGVPAHPDALRAHRIGQVVKKSGTKAVSNQDLSTYANRLQLEQNVSRLTSKERNRGTQFVSGVLSQSGKSLASEAVNKGAKEVGKKALTLARYRK
jgi:hypothetical protein